MLKRTALTDGVIQFTSARGVLGRPVYFTAAYWVAGLLIDTGCAHTAQELLRATNDLRLERIVNTHSHEDHIGANGPLQARGGMPIQAHPLALPIIANPRLQPLQPYRRYFWGWPQPSQATALGEQVVAGPYVLQVIPTPGHSPDHVCFFEPQAGWLFSGDAFVGGRDRALRLGYDIYGIIASLKTLSRLPIKRLFSGSGSVRANPLPDIQAKIEYLEETGERVRQLHAQGCSEEQIGRTLFGPEMRIAYITLGHFSRRHLVRSYMAGTGGIRQSVIR